MKCVLCEKASAKEKFSKALKNEPDLVFVRAQGHLYSYPSSPDVLGAPKDWHSIPWNYDQMKWKKYLNKGMGKLVNDIKEAVEKSDEVIIATDNDPSGEGMLLAQEILSKISLSGKTISRMYFADESEKNIQKAFRERKVISSLYKDPEFLKADFRSKWDYMSMQFTRIATNISGQLLRNGRLKSYMNVLVGDQLKAVAEYKKDPVYEAAFVDEKGHWFLDPKADKTKDRNAVDLSNLRSSRIIIDGTQTKRTAPPKLLDLSALTSLLRGKNIDPGDALTTYQSMYEDDVVSYPRTEDDFITIEQFNELLPLVDRIAEVVNVDKSLLTHREPRSTHIKALCDHGANRPGINVPNNLGELRKYGPSAPDLYELLAKSFLLMFCESYEYKQVKAHVEEYPQYVSSINLPVSLGYRNISDATPPKETPFGETASPDIKETVNPKPQNPTMKWLMVQLKKNGVGTGSTRTSTYVEVCKQHPLFIDKKGKITLTTAGQVNYQLLQGTAIGSADLTKNIQDQMKDVSEGKLNADSLLRDISLTVLNDYAQMQRNSADLQMPAPEEKKPVEKVSGTFNGEEVSFKKKWGEHTFTDSEIIRLLNGETIAFMTSKGSVKGSLQKQKYKKHVFWGFMPDKNEDDYAYGVRDGKEIRFRKVWGAHTFTPEEIEKLVNGETITFEAYGKKGMFEATGSLKKRYFQGKTYWGFVADFGKKDHHD